MRASILCIFSLLCIPSLGFAQQTNLRVFGHLDWYLEQDAGKDPLTTYSLGEHDFFITSSISNRWSFLGEVVVIPNNNGFNASIERARIKYDYAKHHSLIVGKVHTPLNYWNDVYHHGRLFFPTIDRPKAFTTVVPIHTLGLRAQGQNIGEKKFGYDIMVGNGLSSTDQLDLNSHKAILIATHIKPKKGMRIGLSYYRDKIFDAFVGSHSGHNSSNHAHSTGMGTGLGLPDIDYELYSFSYAYFGEKIEVLNESSLNITHVETTGHAYNKNFFLYAGYRFKTNNVLFGIFDYTDISENDRHILPINQTKFGLGFRKEFNYLLVGKLQIERYTGIKTTPTIPTPNKYEIKIQLAYGF